MTTFFIIAFSLWVAISLPPAVYYTWMIRRKGKSNIKKDSQYQPLVSLIIPTYNEAAAIASKLENIQELDYPSDKLQIILVDSASSDGTLNICEAFLAKAIPRFSMTLISEKERKGKSHALNTAMKQAEGEIIATSDADSFWNRDALRKAISYFADPTVGAVTGREKLINIKKSVHTLSEGMYRGFYYTLRLGESNLHSTLIFQGELALYRKSAFKEFEDKPGYSDDIGTVINIISSGYRCIFVPDAVFSDTAAFSLGGRLALKSRRAEHLIIGILHSLELKIEKRFPMPSRVVLFNFYLHVVSPILLIAALITSAIAYVVDFKLLWFVGFFPIILLMRKPRVFASSYLTSNLALILGLFAILTRRNRRSVWRKVEEMRYTK